MPGGSTNPLANELTYSDISFTFNPHPVTGRIPVLKNERAITGALKNLILTNRYERPYVPLYGGNILSLLFENADPFVDYNVRKRIQEAISNYEHRVKLLDVKVEVVEETHTVSIDIIFFVENLKDPVELTISLERVR